jgi:glucose-1-phosphate cytidylyltransferase
MKVVLFCGGFGTRLREHSDTVPKPLVNVGVRPILWHLMRYYAHFGHKDFILCLGYRGDMIREYFLTYNECISNDFTMSEGGKRIELHTHDIADWRITFVETGLHSNIAERLVRVRQYLKGERYFLANYADGLSDIPLDEMVADFKRKNCVATFAAINSLNSFHTVEATADGYALRVGRMQESDIRINGGFFALTDEIFDYIESGDELVEKPFERLIAQRRLAVYRHDGFWRSMDTLKDKIMLDRMEANGNCPWTVWKK